MYLNNKSTTVYIIRHGQSIGNRDRLMLGVTNMDLTELGYRQAERTAQELKNIKIEGIYSSDLIRAYNTALPHAKYHGLDIVCDVRLREVYLGEWERRFVDDLRIECRETYDVEWIEKFGTFRFPGDEGTYEAGKRLYEAIADISSQNFGKTIIISTHSAVLRVFWAIINGISAEDIAEKVDYANNASYSVVKFDGKKFIPVEYGHDSHLADVGITTIKLS